MANFSIDIDLQALPGAFLTNFKGRTATKKCICIPVEDAHLFVGEKGTYLDLQAFELKETRYDQTHLVKQALPKEVYEALTDEQRKAQPILGGIKEFKAKTQDVTEVYIPDNSDDLPF